MIGPRRKTRIATVSIGVAVALCAAAVPEPAWAINDIRELFDGPSRPAPPPVPAEAREQYRLAYQYYSGTGVPRDYPRAIDLARRAAQGGYAPAAFLLGHIYENGLSVKPDLAEARIWYEQAAASGDPAARFNAGVIAARQRDAAAAATAFRAAAEQGFQRAAAAYGQCLETGLGVERNEAEAVAWYRKAAEGGDAVGAYLYGNALARGIGGIAEDSAEAMKWYRVAADRDVAVAQHALGVLNAEGRGVPQDQIAAVGWFKKAADNGLADGMASYAMTLDRGAGVARNVSEAVRWYRRVTEFGQPSAMLALASHYFEGDGVPASTTDAYYWATIALRFLKPDDPLRPQGLELKAAIDKKITMGERVSIDRRAFTFAPTKESSTLSVSTVDPSFSETARAAPARANEPRREPTRAVAPGVEPARPASTQPAATEPATTQWLPADESGLVPAPAEGAIAEPKIAPAPPVVAPTSQFPEVQVND
jgi:hypothetical protein